MSPAAIIQALVTCGREENYSAVASIPGAGVHAQVLRFSDSLRRGGLEQVEALSARDRMAFVKALAVFENTVGGLGSVTALERALPLVADEDHTVLDWILSTTRSYWYYSNGATSYAELQASRAAHARRRQENEAREAKREHEAKARKAEQASANLFNAVRRGDVHAVQALLQKGASPNSCTPDGVPLVKYAEEAGRIAVVDVLRNWPGGASAA
jgi:hypothetical protein